MNSASIYMLSGIMLGSLIILALLARTDANPRANRLLAGSLACSMCYLCGMVMVHSEIALHSIAPRLLVSLYLLGVPLMYGYVRLLVDAQRPFVGRDLLHLLPWAGMVLILFTQSLALTSETIEAARGGWPPHPVSLIAPLLYLVPAAYMYASLSVIRQHQRGMEQIFSYHERHTLFWLKVLVSVYLTLSVAGLCIALLRWVPGVDLWPRSLYSSSMIIAIYYLISFIAISQPPVPRVDDAMEQTADEEKPPPPARVEQQKAAAPVKARYETSALNEEIMQAIWAELEQLMRDKQPYLNSQLRIAELAAQLDIPTHYLSQTINQVAGKSFFELINHYRVEKAKTLLASGASSASSVAFEAGFNSQSVFYRQFKKDAGITPRQYQARSSDS